MGEDKTHPLYGLRGVGEEALNRNFPGEIELAVAAAFDKFDDIIVVLMLDNCGEVWPMAFLEGSPPLKLSRLLVVVPQRMTSWIPVLHSSCL